LHEFDFLTGDAAAAAVATGLDIKELNSTGIVIRKILLNEIYLGFYIRYK
jgi:hypothetical protein